MKKLKIFLHQNMRAYPVRYVSRFWGENMKRFFVEFRKQSRCLGNMLENKSEEKLKKTHNELELEIFHRTAELIEANKRLTREINERKEIEKSIQSRNTILKLFSEMSSRQDYLAALVKYLQEWSGCSGVGIRVLNEAGKIPYEAFLGFSQVFWESENWLSVARDQCSCIRVITGKPEPPDLSAMTPTGSFCCNNTLEFVAGLSEQGKTRFRGVCVQNGFTSVAVIPISYKDKIIGAIHLADKGEGKVPLEIVKFIESLTPLIGEGINKFNLADKIQQNYDLQKIINYLLHLSLKDISFEQLLKQSMEMLVSTPGLGFGPMAAIFLVESNPEILVLKAETNMPPQLKESCGRVPFGRCICGQVALKRRSLFAESDSPEHEVKDPNIPDHAHYCVPILFQERVLGVLNIYTEKTFPPDPKKEEFLSSVADALAGIIQHKQIGKKLNETNELLERVFSSTNFLIAYLDTNFNFIRVNQTYAEADQHTPDFFVGKNHFDLYPNADNLTVFRKVVQTGQSYSAYAQPFVYAQNPERGVTYWDISLQPVKNSSGTVEGLVLSLVDVTKRKQAEEELIKTQKELIDAKRLSDIGTLAATVAHELRNPLAVIRMAAYSIKKKSSGPLLDKHLANIEKKILESDQIINNLLYYSRIKMPEYEKICVYDILDECLNAAKEKFPEWEVVVERRDQGIKSNFIEADGLQIKEVFDNLLNNAYESLTNKKGKLEIVAGYDVIQRELSVSIKDNGSGIDPESLKRVFEPFFTKKTRGTGLGLTVCQQIINLHRGRIAVQSELGAGTTFTVNLPAGRRISRTKGNGDAK